MGPLARTAAIVSSNVHHLHILLAIRQLWIDLSRIDRIEEEEGIAVDDLRVTGHRDSTLLPEEAAVAASIRTPTVHLATM